MGAHTQLPPLAVMRYTKGTMKGKSAAITEETRGKKIPKVPTVPFPTEKEILEAIEHTVKGKDQDATIKLFEKIMIYGHGIRASDVHLEPWKDHGIIRIRVDGILHDSFTLPALTHQELIARLKILTRMRTDEHHGPQDGRFAFNSPLGNVDVRASILPDTNGEKAVLRLLSSQSHQLSLEELGFAPEDLARVERAIKKPWGMILATGPTGSGKTTTIYAILEILNKREVNIASIEDPVEFEIPGANQSQVDHVAKLTFATGLRALLRQDPDIIMVGEIRDEETAKIAVNAAMTGHKLLSTLHTNNSATTIPRLIDMNVEPFLISSTFLCAIAQRLLRRVCDSCKTTAELTKEEATAILNTETATAIFATAKADKITIAKANGCEKCTNTGYRGRVGIYEVLENSPTIQELNARRATSEEIEDQARKEGMTTVAEDGAKKVIAGLTTIEELARVMQE